MSDENDLEVGDRVAWCSVARWPWKRKVGTVVCVVPAGYVPKSRHTKRNAVHPDRIVELDYENYSTATIGSASSREEESYLVAVDSGAGKPKLYWPKAELLVRV